jgi:hypothetical protein
MKVLDAVSGSCWNDLTACCAAMYALVMLMFTSRVKSVVDIESGCPASILAAEAALLC